MSGSFFYVDFKPFPGLNPNFNLFKTTYKSKMEMKNQFSWKGVGESLQARNRIYSYGKLLILGALYDTFDRLGWKLLASDSDAGTISVLERKKGLRFLIHVIPEQVKNVDVIIELEPGSPPGRDSPEEAVGQVFDTMEQIIREALSS